MAIQTSAAPGIAVERRSIQMKLFRDKESMETCVRDQISVPLGQIIGHAFEVKMKEGSTPDGMKTISPFILGDFEAVVYKTGEVVSASGAYLPKYFAETLQAALEKSHDGSHGIAFAVEISVEPTGRGVAEGGIPFSYAVKRLIARRPDSPLETMKRELQEAGSLRLPAPAPLPMMIEGDTVFEPAEETETETTSPSPSPGASHKGGKHKG